MNNVYLQLAVIVIIAAGAVFFLLLEVYAQHKLIKELTRKEK